MSEKETARAEVQKLVEKFHAVPAATRRQYSEQETRIRFILPLFRALGWDDTNPAEVSAEEQISRGFVDFGYYLNGVPVFYLETKKIHSKLSDPENMRQSINYAYLKGVTWAVLTDFEGLMVFNAEWEEKDPIKARFLDLQWEHYANGHFDDLWLLSKAGLQTREIDRVAERFGRKAKKEPVTKTLFADLTQWRHDLFNDIHLMKTTLWASDPRKVDNAVQKLLDRLIFIRSVEDRGVEANQLLPLLRQSKRSELSAKLMRLFRDLDTVYNSNLFAQSELDLMELHDTNLLVDIINGLYKARGGFVSYDFNAISADVLGAVYEQYLGFRAQDPEAQQKVDKSKKRKSQGIYYTPQFVVKYIVAQTVGKLLDGSVLDNAGSGLKPAVSDEGLVDKGLKPLVSEGVLSGSGLKPLVQSENDTSRLMPAEEVFKLRILDPACGSGSFLIETFDVLDRHLSRLHPKATAEERREWRRRILTECLYGVDLDDQAVEVTRLNLMLRAAQERGRLPLLTHIAHGNSLIDDPAVAGETAFKWEERFPLVFAGETRQLWFVTFVTHNSRVSERMVTYGVESGEPLIFEPEDQIIVAEAIAEACQKYNVPVVAWNVLPDHVHMIIGARDEKTLNEAVRKIKGYSSYAFKRRYSSDKGLKPLVSNELRIPGQSGDEDTDPTPVWAQKFNRMPITNQQMLNDIIEYVSHNHEKHTERWGNRLQEVWESGMPNKGLSDKGLKPLVQVIQSVCVPVDEAVHERGGFDVVIGNPPYVRQETLGAGFKTYAEQHYETYAGTADLYVYFIEQGMKLLKPGGMYGVIVANKWMRAGYGKPLRQWLKRQQLEKIVDFGDLPVFEEATTYPCILVARSQDSGLRSDSGLKPTVLSDANQNAGQNKGLAEKGLSDKGLKPLVFRTKYG